MSAGARPSGDGGLCVVGFVYLEVFLPASVGAPPAGRERFVPSLPIGFGGALNVASVASALGVRTLILHPSCGPLDPSVHALAGRLRVEARAWPAESAAVSLVFSSPSDRAFLSSADFDSLAGCPPLPGDGWIHVAGLEEALRMEDALEDARARGARLCVSGSWAPAALRRIAELSGRRWDLIVLNEDEAAAVHSDRRRALDHLSRLAGDVVVTNGPGRVEARMGGRWVRIPVPPAGDGGDYTGVGDAFCAGLLGGLIRGRDAESALRLGVEVASRVVRIRGGVVLDRALLADLVPP